MHYPALQLGRDISGVGIPVRPTANFASVGVSKPARGVVSPPSAILPLMGIQKPGTPLIAGPIDTDSELHTILMLRQMLREHGYLPDANEGEQVVSFRDALQQDWFTVDNEKLDLRRFTTALVETWNSSQAPCAYMKELSWIQIFLEARSEIKRLGLGCNSEEVTLYRGCLPAHAKGMSWTTDLHTAVWFSMRQIAIHGEGEVYKTTVPRAAVLADLRKHFPIEHELVIDPRQIVELHELPLSSADKWSIVEEYRDGMRIHTALAPLQGYLLLGEITTEIPTPPPGGWKPVPQCVDETAPGYFQVPFTPPTVAWPRPDNVWWSTDEQGKPTLTAPFAICTPSAGM